jgi:hypothetical protein
VATKRPKSDEDVIEVGLVADPDEDEEGGLPEGFGVATDGDEDLEDEPEDEDLDEEDDEVADVVDLVEAEGEDDEEAIVPDVVAAVLAGEPESAEDAVAVAGLIEDEDGDEVEGVRPGIDFVCDKCHLVKRRSQLAKRSTLKKPICRSCA